MPQKEALFTEKAPQPGPWSSVIRYGDLLFLAGQMSENVKNGECEGGSVAHQTEVILTNIKNTLEDVGSSLDKVLSVTIHMTDLSKKPELNEVYRRFFPNDPPARTAVGVNALDDGLDVEITVIAGR